MSSISDFVWASFISSANEDYSARQINHLAEEYLAQHGERLRAEAEQVIATSPYFVRWRLPPEVFVKSIEIEHSPNANSANPAVIAND